MEIKRNITTKNFDSGSINRIKYIVVHFTANNGDTAYGNTNYFKSYRGASAHYFVDENGIYQSIEDKNIAWHCGAKKYKHSTCRNSNSLGVELCSRKDSKGNYYFMDKTVDNAVELVKMLMAKYNVPIANVIRHYDITGKNCPEPFVRDIKAWQNFKDRLEEEDMTEAEVKKIANDMIYKYVTSKEEAVYDTIEEVPEWGEATVKKLINRGLLKGNENGLDLSYTLLRLLVVNDRAGLYD